MGLPEDFELVFTAGVEGELYVDPAELILLFPTAPYVEVLELINYFSHEVDELLEDGEITYEAREYIKASVACALSRLYDLSGLGGGVGDAAFRLGDLSVERRSSGQGGGRSSINRANAQTWCELAAVMREELLPGRTGAGIRGVVRGDRWPNPMPARGIRPKEDTPMTIYADDCRDWGQN